MSEYEITGPGLTDGQRRTLVEALASLSVPLDTPWRFSVVLDIHWYQLMQCVNDVHCDRQVRVITMKASLLSNGDRLVEVLRRELASLIPKPAPSPTATPTELDFDALRKRSDEMIERQKAQRLERQRLDRKKYLRVRVTKRMYSELEQIAARERRTVNSLVAKILYDFAHRYDANVSGIYPIHWQHHRPGVVIRSRVDQETLGLLRAKAFRRMPLSKYAAKILTQYLVEQSNAVGEHPARYSNEFFIERTWDLFRRRGFIAPMPTPRGGTVEDVGKETGTF